MFIYTCGCDPKYRLFAGQSIHIFWFELHGSRRMAGKPAMTWLRIRHEQPIDRFDREVLIPDLRQACPWRV
jgi:hypothetical protein